MVQGRERDAQCVVRMREGPEADAHVRQRQRMNGGSVMGMIRGERLQFLGAGFPKKDKVCGG